jgi:hypothetical protein
LGINGTGELEELEELMAYDDKVGYFPAGSVQ